MVPLLCVVYSKLVQTQRRHVHKISSDSITQVSCKFVHTQRRRFVVVPRTVHDNSKHDNQSSYPLRFLCLTRARQFTHDWFTIPGIVCLHQTTFLKVRENAETKLCGHMYSNSTVPNAHTNDSSLLCVVAVLTADSCKFVQTQRRRFVVVYRTVHDNSRHDRQSRYPLSETTIRARLIRDSRYPRSPRFLLVRTNAETTLCGDFSNGTRQLSNDSFTIPGIICLHQTNFLKVRTNAETTLCGHG